MGSPTWCFSFTSDAFDIYHVNDFMKTRGWRFIGQQYPNAIHMCVTRPQTQPGVVESFAEDLDAAVRYTRSPTRATPASGAVYGGAPKGVPEVQKMISDFMVGFQRRLAGRPARPQLSTESPFRRWTDCRRRWYRFPTFASSLA